MTDQRRRIRRSRLQMLKDLLSFPLRALTLFHRDWGGFSCQATERYDYAASQVTGYCLDVGCGSNRFVRDFLAGRGIGVDVHRYAENHDGLLLEDPSVFPWADACFDTVTFLANLNHVPRESRDPELAEAARVLRPGGTIIVTMALPVVEVVVHKLIAAYDRVLGTRLDHDNLRGMAAGEAYFLTGAEIRGRLARAGFVDVTYRPFVTQWCLNGMYIGRKPAAPPSAGSAAATTP
jgi:SAM-dependent methyltransferase